MSPENEEPSGEGLGNAQDSTRGINWKGAPGSLLFLLSDKMNPCLYFFFPTEFQSIPHGSALAEALDRSASEKHLNYSETPHVVQRFHPPPTRECRKPGRDSSPPLEGFSS